MIVYLKIIWVVALVINIACMTWFLIGSTANFQRSFDIISTIYLVFFWIPSIILTIVSIRLLIKGWVPSGNAAYVGFIFGVLLLLIFSYNLFQGVNTRGWLTEVITSDSLKVTSDKKYEYRIDLINVFQKNSHARLFVRNRSTFEEMEIAVDIHTNNIIVLGINRTEENHWVLMEPTDTKDHYILATTREVGSIFGERFEIDIGTRTSKRLK